MKSERGKEKRKKQRYPNTTLELALLYDYNLPGISLASEKNDET